MRRSVTNGDIEKGQIDYYDLYGTFGCALGTDPGVKDKEISKLKVAILPLPGGVLPFRNIARITIVNG